MSEKRSRQIAIHGLHLIEIMSLVKNFGDLARSYERQIVLEVIEAGLTSIQPTVVLKTTISQTHNMLAIQSHKLNLNDFGRIILIGFGKGSAKVASYMENLLGEHLTEGYVIDVESEPFVKIKQTVGTHPLPSQQNLLFTQNIFENLNSLTERDLVLVVVNGGGSVLFEYPYRISQDKLIEVNRVLLQSGATIHEINIVRKHLSRVKGGGLAKLLYPATIVTLISSDVPGNDLSTIASGPTVQDSSSIEEALKVLREYNLDKKLSLSREDFLETPKENHYFEKVTNILILSNLTALEAMKKKAEELGYRTQIFSDRLQGEAKIVGRKLIDAAQTHSILLAGGETTVRVTQKGEGGRNQEVVLGTLSYLSGQTVISSFDSDGWDNSPFAGALGDALTIKSAKALKLDPKVYLNSNNSLSFFRKTGDGIITGRLPSNVADLMIVFKK